MRADSENKGVTAEGMAPSGYTLWRGSRVGVSGASRLQPGRLLGWRGLAPPFDVNPGGSVKCTNC